jgi:hypothetical protein
MKKTILLLVFFTLISCKKNTEQNESLETNTAKIGSLEWMSSNLNTNKFQNGDEIYEAKNSEDWINAGNQHKPAWCYYNNDVKNEHLGKIYNWYAVNDKRGLAPKGWHIPSRVEWLDKKLNSQNENKIHDLNLLCGNRDYEGNFTDLGNFGYWWTSTEQNSTDAWVHFLREDGWESEDYGYKLGGKYVLCVRN